MERPYIEKTWLMFLSSEITQEIYVLTYLSKRS